jgi:hypothetical protein
MRSNADVYASIFKAACDAQVDEVIRLTELVNAARIDGAYDFESFLLSASRNVALLNLCDVLRAALTNSKSRAERILRERDTARARDKARRAAKATTNTEEEADA